MPWSELLLERPEFAVPHPQRMPPDCDPNCCEVPNLDNKCMSGPNNLQTCATDTDCRFCVGGAHNGDPCTTTTPTCLDPHPCTNLVCDGGPRNGLACTAAGDCAFNGVCRGHCVKRSTGGDNCEDAYIHVITVPDVSEGPKVVTVSGNNNG